MKFIKLTRCYYLSRCKFLMPLDIFNRVIIQLENDERGTCIYDGLNIDRFIQVEETPEQIIELIKQAELLK